MKPNVTLLPGIIACFLLSPVINAQHIATITVEAGNYNRHNTPVFVNLGEVTWLPDSMLILQEINESGKTLCKTQTEQGTERKMWWIIPDMKAGETKTYHLLHSKAEVGEHIISTEKTPDALIVKAGNKDILRYHSAVVYPPRGVDSSYRRSGFMHPVYAPNGAVLSNMQPADHYHHYGFWNPWTDTEFEGLNIDFWNLGRKLGTVQYKSFISVTGGVVFGGFKALHDHVIFPDSAPRTVMNEVWDVRAYNVPGAFLWDFTSTLNLATQSKLIINEYRYAGLGFRATAEWTNQNSKALTSEGKTRKDTDGTRAKWCFIEGETGKGRAGILFMSYPANYNHPEPVRMWPEDANNGRGDVFFNFCPTKTMDWILLPGMDYVLKYRILVYNDGLTREQAEMAWNDFANPPLVTWLKH